MEPDSTAVPLRFGADALTDPVQSTGPGLDQHNDFIDDIDHRFGSVAWYDEMVSGLAAGDSFFDAPEFQPAWQQETDNIVINTTSDEQNIGNNVGLMSTSPPLENADEPYAGTEELTFKNEGEETEIESETSLSEQDDEGDDGDDDDDGLFNRTFRQQPSTSPEQIDVQKDTGGARNFAAFLAATSGAERKPSKASEADSSATTSSSKVSIVATRESHANTDIAKCDSPAQSPPPHIGPDPEKDISQLITQHKRFHKRACNLIPRLALAPHRYWIGVLATEREPRNVTREEHLTWMKGNRLTTIETVTRTFEVVTAFENFVLLLGSEKVEFKDRMEELDIFGDKVVILRAVVKGSLEARGRKMTIGLVTQEVKEDEVIEID